jgi:hypothetical protein
MTQRERVLASGVIGVLVVAAGAVLVNTFYLQPLQAKERAIVTARQDRDAKEEQLRKALADRLRLENYRQLSLAPDVFLSRREYSQYLTNLFRDSGFAPDSFNIRSTDPAARAAGQARGPRPAFTPLIFTIAAHGSLAHLVKMLDEFYHTGLLHRISVLTLRRPLTPDDQGADSLVINMTVEALIVDGAPPREQLLPNVDPRLVAEDVVAALKGAPVGLGLALWAAGPTGPRGPGALATSERKYDDITRKDIFFGPTPKKTNPDKDWPYLDHVVLVMRSQGRKHEATLWDQSSNRFIRLREDSVFHEFTVRDGSGELLFKGEVVKITERDVFFKSHGLYYRMHMGDNLRDATRRSLPEHEVSSLLAKPLETTRANTKR